MLQKTNLQAAGRAVVGIEERTIDYTVRQNITEVRQAYKMERPL